MGPASGPRRSDRTGEERGRALLVLVAVLACGGAVLGALSSMVGASAPEAPIETRVDADGTRAWLFGAKLDLNRASAVDLARVPGIGRRLARAIIDERARRGGFRSLDEVDAVRGVGPAKLRLLARYVEVRAAQREATSEARPVTTVP